jgi:hypothetical protein
MSREIPHMTERELREAIAAHRPFAGFIPWRRVLVEAFELELRLRSAGHDQVERGRQRRVPARAGS